MDKIENLNSSRPLAFNTEWLKENLPRYLWREDEMPGTILQVEILYIGESSKQVTVLYQIELYGQGGESRRQMYVGYLAPGNDLAAEHEMMLQKAKIQPPFGRPVALVPEAVMILVAFPNDQKLPLFTEAVLQPWLATHLREVANGGLDGMTWQVQEAKTEVLRYVPDKRCTTRCRIKIKTATGLAKEISFIAKQLVDAEKAKRQYEDLMTMRQAWSGNGIAEPAVHAETKLPVRLPQALAWDEQKAAVFIEEIPGKNLGQALAEIDLARVMPAVGAMLANLHRADKLVKKSISRQSELAEVHGVIQKVAAAFPVLQSRLQRLFNQLESTPWDDSPVTLLHGTFRLNHIVIHGDELALIDFDSLRMGHPAFDVSNFLSSLYYLEVQGRLEPSQRQKIVRHFIEGYAAKAPLPVLPEVLLWFLTDLLIKKQAYKYIKHFHEDRAQKVERMLALAEATVAECQNAPKDLDFAAAWELLP